MSARLKIAPYLIVLLTVAFHPACFGQVTKDDASRPDFHMPALDKLIGTVARSLGDEYWIRTEAMPRLLHWWRERGSLGAANSDLSNAFLFIMEENPKAFFVSMSTHPRDFAEWLKEMPDDSFVWMNAPPCPLDAKRKELLLILQHTELTNPSASHLKDQALRVLSAVRCRQIQ